MSREARRRAVGTALGNMREHGVRGLAVYRLNHACQHRTVIGVDHYPDEIEVPSFALRMKCSKCGGKRADMTGKTIGTGSNKSPGTSETGAQVGDHPRPNPDLGNDH
jgi:hypothetical protein